MSTILPATPNPMSVFGTGGAVFGIITAADIGQDRVM